MQRSRSKWRSLLKNAGWWFERESAILAEARLWLRIKRWYWLKRSQWFAESEPNISRGYEPSRKVFLFLIVAVVVTGVSLLFGARGCDDVAYDAFDAGLEPQNRGRGLKEGR